MCGFISGGWGLFAEFYGIKQIVPKQQEEKATKHMKMLHHSLKCRLLKKSLSKIFNTKVTNTFKIIQVQQKRSHMKCFYSIVSEECCFHGKDKDITVWCCSG